jgi:hypothetical protein
MSAHEDTSEPTVDELARRRQERAAENGERPLRERVRDEARRSKRRHEAANRARERTGDPDPSQPDPFGTGGAA